MPVEKIKLAYIKAYTSIHNVFVMLHVNRKHKG